MKRVFQFTLHMLKKCEWKWLVHIRQKHMKINRGLSKKVLITRWIFLNNSTWSKKLLYTYTIFTSSKLKSECFLARTNWDIPFRSFLCLYVHPPTIWKGWRSTSWTELRLGYLVLSSAPHLARTSRHLQEEIDLNPLFRNVKCVITVIFSLIVALTKYIYIFLKYLKKCPCESVKFTKTHTNDHFCTIVKFFISQYL